MKYNNFSILFKQYIHSSQLSISLLAKRSGIDRTLIQKYISGNRLPQNYGIVEKIIQFLALTQLQKIELKHLYKLEKIGHERFNKLLLLKNIIANNNIVYIILLSIFILINKFKTFE